MSLKHFHFLFILFAALFSLGFGAWAILGMDPETGARGMGIFSAILGVVLAFYGVWFRKKARRVIT